MKRIGLLGGMSWESTALYYRLINEGVAARLGGLHSADLVMVSVDFADVEAMQSEGRWDDAGRFLASGAQALQAAGADFVVLCTNTMHKVAPAVEGACSIPLLHLADATASAVTHDGLITIGLLGTAFTMEQDFYRGRLEEHGLNVIIPEAAERADVHRVIYDELCHGVVRDESRRRYLQIIANLVRRGAQGIVLGCTEIELLISPDEHPGDGVRLYPTTSIHARAAVERALSGSCAM